jgi:hypothetical protein
MPTSDLFEWLIEGSMDPVTKQLNSRLVLPRGLIVPKNSGIQNVWANMMHTLGRARRFKPPFREYAIDMAMADVEGCASISSENGAMIREFNTSRMAQPLGTNIGQPKTEMDEFLYGKEYLKNNPKEKGSWLKF